MLTPSCRAAAIAATMFARLPSHSSGVWFRTAAPTLTSCIYPLSPASDTRKAATVRERRGVQWFNRL